MRLYFFKCTFIIIIISMLAGCASIAVMNTPKKMPRYAHTQLSDKAETYFWSNLHTGRYHKIRQTTKLMTAAYLANPNDPNLAAHLGFLHIWKITERQRKLSIANNPTIVNEIILAKKYFHDAVILAPGDARFQGFYGDSLLIEGKIFNDEREEVRAYFVLQDAIKRWPQFNYFTAGYPMSILPTSNHFFQEALNWQWKTLDLCAGKIINRANPVFIPYPTHTVSGLQRACWNSWIAPHNFEGFFLNMGDMLVKNHEWQKAIVIYKNAKLSPTYHSWPYRAMLEKRIEHAQTNVQAFQTTAHNRDHAMLFNSGYGCVVCHER